MTISGHNQASYIFCQVIKGIQRESAIKAQYRPDQILIPVTGGTADIVVHPCDLIA